MNSIKIMNDEHVYIMRMIKVIRSNCFKVLKGEDINYEDFDSIINFIRNFADKYHHQKEEKILFSDMLKYLGETAEKVVRHGMLVEHDLGRLHVKELELALERVKDGDEESKLDVISNAISYTHLLERHIDKEDRVIYKYAERELEESVLLDIDKRCMDYELENSNIREEYILVLEQLENKYIIKGEV